VVGPSLACRPAPDDSRLPTRTAQHCFISVMDGMFSSMERLETIRLGRCARLSDVAVPQLTLPCHHCRTLALHEDRLPTRWQSQRHLFVCNVEEKARGVVPPVAKSVSIVAQCRGIGQVVDPFAESPISFVPSLLLPLTGRSSKHCSKRSRKKSQLQRSYRSTFR